MAGRPIYKPEWKTFVREMQMMGNDIDEFTTDQLEQRYDEWMSHRAKAKAPLPQGTHPVPSPQGEPPRVAKWAAGSIVALKTSDTPSMVVCDSSPIDGPIEGVIYMTMWFNKNHDVCRGQFLEEVLVCRD